MAAGKFADSKEMMEAYMTKVIMYSSVSVPTA